jgi:hypothetical protein
LFNVQHGSLYNITIYILLQLVVHCGVSGIAQGLTLEQQAHNDGYDKFDISGSKISYFLCPLSCIFKHGHTGIFNIHLWIVLEIGWYEL